MMNRQQRRRALSLGATGQYPRGKVNKQDEGELRFAIGRDAKGNVVLDFGKDVSWMALPPADAIELAKRLAEHAGAKRVEIEF